jgi:hypothetical protein
MIQNGLNTFLDSESINHYYDVKKDSVERLLSVSGLPLDIQRTALHVNYEHLSRIKTFEQMEDNSNTLTLKMFERRIFRRLLTEGEAKFVLLMLRHSSLLKIYVSSFVQNAIYVTENIFLLGNYLSKKEKPGLNHFFPYMRVVDINQALEIIDLFAKSHGIYLGTRSKTELTSWYQIYLYTKSTYFPLIYKNTLRIQPTKPSQTVQALIFRFLKTLLCVDYLGIQHYLGHSRETTFNLASMNRGLNELKKGSPYPEGLGSLMDLDDLLITFYHVEYLISLVTGIFDNLAVETASYYKIKNIHSIRISLSPSIGNDFLKEVKKQNCDLKKYIDSYRPFINLIYEFRDKVIHREGLERIISPIGFYWSNLIIVNHQIKDYLKQCGDKPSPYKIVTEWGLIEREGRFYLDPFYFAKKVIANLTVFADKYFQLMGYKAFLNNIDSRDTFMKAFINDVEYFKMTSIRV